MEIKSTAQALAVINSVQMTLNQLVVQGCDNCYRVVAIHNDMAALTTFLSDEADAEEICRKEYSKNESGKH